MIQKKKTWVIGITGNIGAGKSTVTRALSEQGAYILDADEMTRQLQRPGSETLDAIAAAFGENMIGPDGALNRKALGALVFADPKQRERLNALMWPRLIQLTKEKIQEKGGICIIDAALLIESGLHEICDEVWLIVAPEKVRCERIIKRDHLDDRQAMLRIQSQMSEEEKRKYATRVLDSMVGIDTLIENARQLYQQVRGGLYD